MNKIREERWDPSYESVPPTSNDQLAFSLSRFFGCSVYFRMGVRFLMF